VRGRGTPRTGVAADRSLASPDVRSGDSVYVCDRETRILSWNHSLERLTGIPARQAVGRRCCEVIGGTDDAGRPVCTETCVVSRNARRGRPLSCPPLVMRAKRGPMAVEISTLIARDGAEQFVVHVVRERPS
jgi:PAS domain-containing protein